ncbi:Calreticulin-domain-containing protein [Neocallimastix californiae]|uniref:Calreticulin-domain-containing protein n=1 Tax=Neocallimastix californiae TaxID=1754190 RepID=A0A1Y2EP09_9FUNG|nr:Calreticulin-domain-containing protein [Neocallimastix californiae]|eukprot:ORY73288.1 Calreticulin-domain-containing protein [Neocallimastix californiae]
MKMRFAFKGIASLFLASLVAGKVYFKETFDDDTWKTKWIQNEDTKKFKNFEVVGSIYDSESINKGLKTTTDNAFYAISAPLDEIFSTKEKTLVIQYTMKQESKLTCSSNYIKLFPRNLKQKQLNSNSHFNLLFGPNKCKSFNETQAFLTYKQKKPLLKKHIDTTADHLTHLYTFVIKPDQTYQILIDNEEKASGHFFDDWDYLEPKMINDPKIKKPENWVDDEFIDDPNDKRPEGLDVIPRYIPDPESVKPDDWDEIENGMWIPVLKENPEFQEWYPKTIRNPAYMGEWIHPKIENPDYYEDDEIYVQEHAYVGFEFYQSNAGTLFDNIIITDNLEEAQAFAKETAIDKKTEEELINKYIKEQEILKKQREFEEAKRLEEEFNFGNYKDDDLEFLNDESSSDEESNDDESDDESNDESDDDDDEEDSDDEFVIYDDKKKSKKTKKNDKKDEL